MTTDSEWLSDSLILLAQAQDPLLKRWWIELAPGLSGQREALDYGPDRPCRCLVCDEITTDLLVHRESHRAEAEKLRDEDLVPLTVSMRNVLRIAQLGDDDTVLVAGIRCIPRPFAIVLVTPINYEEMRWAFNRIWFDDDFADALITAGQIPRGSTTFIRQQMGKDAHYFTADELRTCLTPEEIEEHFGENT